MTIISLATVLATSGCEKEVVQKSESGFDAKYLVGSWTAPFFGVSDKSNDPDDHWVFADDGTVTVLVQKDGSTTTGKWTVDGDSVVLTKNYSKGSGKPEKWPVIVTDANHFLFNLKDYAVKLRMTRMNAITK